MVFLAQKDLHANVHLAYNFGFVRRIAFCTISLKVLQAKTGQIWPKFEFSVCRLVIVLL